MKGCNKQINLQNEWQPNNCVNEERKLLKKDKNELSTTIHGHERKAPTILKENDEKNNKNGEEMSAGGYGEFFCIIGHVLSPWSLT
jgi:hypothetical protein